MPDREIDRGAHTVGNDVNVQYRVAMYYIHRVGIAHNAAYELYTLVLFQLSHHSTPLSLLLVGVLYE